MTGQVTDVPRVGDPATRERLLRATISIAAERGVAAVTYRSVAAEAGVAHGLVRFYFGSGQVMLTEAFELAAREDASEARLLVDDIDSFGAELTHTVSRNRARSILQYDYLLSAVRGTAPLERVEDLYDEYIARVGETLRNVRITDEDGSLAALVFAALDGLVLQHAIYGDEQRTDRALEHVRECLRLLQAREAGRA
jgi:AcrR family transcriptional regulator